MLWKVSRTNWPVMPDRPLDSEANRRLERRRWAISVTVPLLLVLLIWSVYLWGLWGNDGFYWLGIYPRSVGGLVGVFLSPLLHSGAQHAFSNSVPLLLLGAALFYFYPQRALSVTAIGWLGSGLGVWLIGRPEYHIGASGLVYAIAAFIFTSGVRSGQKRLAAISLLVVFLYGGLVWGLLPLDMSLSWEGHLSGALLGVAMSVSHRDENFKREGYGSEAPYRYDGITHTGAPGWKVRYRG